MSKYKTCRGMRDLMPVDYKKYAFLSKIIQDSSEIYGYKRMQSVNVEESNLYNECYDEDLTSQLLTIENRFTNAVSLNYDNTISILRGVVENKLYVDKSLPLKFMMLKEEYRYNKRDTNSCSSYKYNFECIGDKSVYLDVENVLVMLKVLKDLDLVNYNLRIKNFNESEEYYLTYKQTLTNLDIVYEEDEEISGSYYTGIAYEIDVDDEIGLVSGGRYDDLIEKIGGVKICCNGSKIDFDRLIRVAEDNDLFPNLNEEIDFYIIPMTEGTFKYGLYVSELLRNLGSIVEIHYKEYDLRRLDDLLDRVDVAFAIVIDENDVIKETLTIRNSYSKEQRKVKLKDFMKDLEKLIEEE